MLKYCGFIIAQANLQTILVNKSIQRMFLKQNIQVKGIMSEGSQSTLVSIVVHRSLYTGEQFWLVSHETQKLTPFQNLPPRKVSVD